MKKRILSIVTASVMILWGCGSKKEEKPEPITLTNHMTETELEKASIHRLTLLDDPGEKEHTVSIEIYSIDDKLKQIEDNKDQLTPEEYEDGIEWFNSEKENNSNELFYGNVLIDGCYYNGVVLPANYDGGALEFSYALDCGNGSELKIEELEFKTLRSINHGQSNSG